MSRYVLEIHVEAPEAADVRDLGDAFREALRRAQRRGHSEEPALPYSRCRIDHVTTRPDPDE